MLIRLAIIGSLVILTMPSTFAQSPWRSVATPEMISVTPGDAPGNGPSGVGATNPNFDPNYTYCIDWRSGISISEDGVIVAFDSRATNLTMSAPGGSGVYTYMRNRGEATTYYISTGGECADEFYGDLRHSFVSGDGQIVAYISTSDENHPLSGRNLVVLFDTTSEEHGCFFPAIDIEEFFFASPGTVVLSYDGEKFTSLMIHTQFTTCGLGEIIHYVRDVSDVTGWIPPCPEPLVDPNTPFIVPHFPPVISGNGEWVFSPGECVNSPTAQVWATPTDQQTESVVISKDASGDEGNGDSGTSSLGSRNVASSYDGRYVVFLSQATNLTEDSVNGSTNHLYLVDRDTNENGIFDEEGHIKTILISKNDCSGEPANCDSYTPSISYDGRYVSFVTTASNLSLGSSYGISCNQNYYNLLVYDRDVDGNGVFDEPGSCELVRVTYFDSPGCKYGAIAPVISGDGSTIAFGSNCLDDVADGFQAYVVELTTPSGCVGDIDGDGSVGLSDWLFVNSIFGEECGDIDFDRRADLDGDGEIGLNDLLLVINNWGPCP